MAKSRKGRGGQIHRASKAPRPGASGRLTGRSKLFASLESFLGKAPIANPNVPMTSVVGDPGRPTRSTQTGSAQAREAERCAAEGVSLIKQGRHAEAIALFQRLVELNPRVAASHHDLGLALLGAGRPEHAAQAFSAAARLDPRLATAHQFLGVILDELGQERKAMASYQAAVALRPDLVAAQWRLGDLYLKRLQLAEAAATFRAAAAATAGTATARLSEARALVALRAFDEALAATRAVVEANPENPEAHSFLGKLLAEAGLSAEAAAHHLRVTELAPGLASAWAGVATNRKFTADDGPLIARMNDVLARPNLLPRDRQALHFALGKAYDDIGNYQAAMREFEAGNRLRAPHGGGLRREALARRVDQLIQATPPGYRDRQPDRGVEDATPVFIVGMPRSGSTLIEQILSSHPEVTAGGELQFWAARDTPREDTWSITATPEATRRLAGEYLAKLRAIDPNARRITDKALNNFMLLGVIHRVFPNATLIHCRRHPIDTALSIFRTNFVRSFDFLSSRGDLVFYYRQYQRLMAHWRKVLPPDRFIEVDYEALVADPEPQARRLIAACGLEWSDACLAPHLNPRTVVTASLWQARQPIYRTSVERWRRYEPWLGELRELTSEV